MSTTADIREAIAQSLETIPDIGVVHRYERYANQQGAIAQLYQWGNQLRGWHIRRVALTERQPDEAPDVTTEWEIRGYMALADAGASELAFDDLIDAIRAKFRADLTIGGTVATTQAEGITGIQLRDSGPVLFGGMLCHKAVLRLVTRQFCVD
jgi:hypothetical protein